MTEPLGFRGYVIEVRDLRQLHRAIETLQQQRTILEETESEAWRVDGPAATASNGEAIPTTLVRSDRLVSLGQLAASVAHELNNPLFSIITCAKILIRDVEQRPNDTDPQRLLKSVRTILSESSRCSTILREFLGYARVNRPGSDRVSLGALLESLETLVAAKATEQRVNIEHRAAQPDTVRADPNQLQQVFLNIALNALQAMPGGGVLRFTVEPDPAAGRVRVSVADTGAGIPGGLLARVMEPFFTTKEPGQGTGLGLSVARDVVQRHGGSIDIQSKVGEGTCVAVTLPLAPSTQEDPA
jgi:two-component system NtrC family sensor kinase